eukprot:GHUV01029274.1.p1 GENE.GHUV01029274.1~~GHUV01029274.1.p1  ORF type:complete len:124 (-),score=17.37 GHUV01029274.1:108-479(-)
MHARKLSYADTQVNVLMRSNSTTLTRSCLVASATIYTLMTPGIWILQWKTSVDRLISCISRCCLTVDIDHKLLSHICDNHVTVATRASTQVTQQLAQGINRHIANSEHRETWEYKRRQKAGKP